MDTRSQTRWGHLAHFTDRVAQSLERFVHVEASSGVVLLLTTVTALWWANSSMAAHYFALWQTPISITYGAASVSTTFSFLINDGLMTIFFLLAGLEIRRELHEGALSTWQQATLPIIAAVGGVVMPGLIYALIATESFAQRGWAIPIATDIAFALGVLALLGKRIPRAVRVLLLALAIIDDIIAVLVIAIFYSDTLRMGGLLGVAGAWLLLRCLQYLGFRSAWAYVLPGIGLWGSLLYLGVHPTLTGVVLGLLTPVVALRDRPSLLQRGRAVLRQVLGLRHAATSPRVWLHSRQTLNDAYLEAVPPVVRIETALHPWVAFGIMPLFALANAGVPWQMSTLTAPETLPVGLGIALGLLLGKPLGIVLACYLSIRCGIARLDPEIGWRGLILIALLAGIGFTMSIFIAMLAFPTDPLLAVAKQAILLASLLAAVLALGYGRKAFPPAG